MLPALIISLLPLLMGQGACKPGTESSNPGGNTEPPGVVFRDPTITISDSSYFLEQLHETAMGLPKQIDLMPNYDLLISDPNNERLIILSNGTISTLVDKSNNVNAHAAAALSDGNVCYSTSQGGIIKIDPASKELSVLAYLPNGVRVNALSTDKNNNIYICGSDSTLYRLDSGGNLAKLFSSLPFDYDTLTDLEIASNGIIYVAGFNRVISIDTDYNVQVIAEGLQYEPVWVSVDSENNVFVNETSQGLQQYDPVSGNLAAYRIKGFGPFGDIIADKPDELIFYEQEIIYNYNLVTHQVGTLFSILGNSHAFTVDSHGTVFLSTPGHRDVVRPHIVSLTGDGNITHYDNLNYNVIFSIYMNSEDRLCLHTDEGFKIVNDSGQAEALHLNLPSELTDFNYNSVESIAVGLDGSWYCGYHFEDTIRIIKITTSGQVILLPVVIRDDIFNATVFNGFWGFGLDIGANGKLAMIATAMGDWTTGGYFQRVFRLDDAGNQLIEIANYDSNRVGGMVDLKIAADNTIYVLTCQGSTGGPDVIYRIDSENNSNKFVEVKAGNDPKSVAVDSSGRLYFSTTKGIYRVSPK